MSESQEVQIAILKEQQVQNTKEHEEIKKMIQDFIESADKKFAPAWVGTFVYALIILIVSSLVGGAISLLFK